jgi:uncharacterized protein
MQLTHRQLLNAAYPHPTQDLKVRETHLSLVVLTGDYVYKIKKALRLDFIDASDLDRRRELCLEELRLNQRYAPEIYLEVTPIVRTASGLSFGGSGELVEYAVRMRQFNPADELHALLAARRVEAHELRALAARLAQAHCDAAVSNAPPPQRTAEFQRIVRSNTLSIERNSGLIGADETARSLTRWMNEELAACVARLEDRERTGYVRECHGDLHTRNVVRWRGELTPFDCIEFDPALRFIDTLSDAAFLVMDLMHLGRSDLAFVFLNRYLEADGDYAGLELLRLFMVHRALVRTKVDLIEASQHLDSPDPRASAIARLATAARLAQCSQPMLIIMHGASGSGKSWLSEQLAPALGAVRIRSDVERKRLAGVDLIAPQTAPIDEGLYTFAMNERTYAHLAACARACLRGGLHAIVDAAFLKRAERDAFLELARTEGRPFAILACSADPAALAARIARRAATMSDPSDATQAVLARQLQTMETLAPDEAQFAVHADTRATDVLETSSQALLAFGGSASSPSGAQG